MILTRRLPFSTRIALLSALVVLAVACGDKKSGAPAATARADKKAPIAAAKPAKQAKAKPTPPALKLAVDKVLLARITERCALKGGEPADDALVLAAAAFAGRIYQPPLAKPADQDVEKAGKPGGKRGAAEPAKAAVKAAEPAVAGALVPAGSKVTSRGRTYPDDPAHQRWLKDYAADSAAAEGWPAWKSRMDEAVAACRWAPEIGLIDGELIDRYTGVFVQITCLQDKHRGPDGRVDDVAHARAAIEVFKANDFDARSFSKLGLIMARFPKVQATLHAVRAKRCPDPRSKRAGEANQGDYIGTLSGQLRGELKMTAKDGKLSGALVLTRGRRLKKSITVPLTGTIDGQRLHLNGVSGQDWLRLDCASTQKVCDWSGEIGFKKRKGTWAYRRPPTSAAPAAAPAAKGAAGQGLKAGPARANVGGKPAVAPAGAAAALPVDKPAPPPARSAPTVAPKVVNAPAPAPALDPAAGAKK